MWWWPWKKRKSDVGKTPGVQHTDDPNRQPSPSALPAPGLKDQPHPEPLGEPDVLLGNPKLSSDPRQYAPGVESIPDSILDGGEIDGLPVRAASLRGDEHRHYGEVRQDCLGVWTLAPGHKAGPEEPVLIACVADGVGSEPLSHLGSSMVCRLVRQEIESQAAAMLDPAQEGKVRDRCERVVAEVGNRLRLEAHQRDLSAKALSTTLVAALVGGLGAKGRRTVFFSVGDSPAFILRQGTFMPVFGGGDDGLISSSSTDALPAAPAASLTVAVGELWPGDVMVLCTDGLSNPLRDKNVSQRLAQWWQSGTVPGLAQFLWQLSFRAQSYGDDRTAVCVWNG